jgi:F-type H+-transporting ATPase subunit gamma
MNMVASAKLRNAQSRIERFRPYADKFYEMLGSLAAGAGEDVHPLLEVRETIATTGIVLITSDRGLCGSFNTNLINTALRLAASKKSEGKNVKLYCVGKKGRNTVRKSEYELANQYVDIMNTFDFTLANDLGLEVINAYLTGQLDEVILIYGEFVSMAKQIPTTLRILPMTAEERSRQMPGRRPSTSTSLRSRACLAELLPRFIKVQVYRGLLDTSASEHAARMTAMDNATRACDDMVGSLTLLFNKTRQAVITKELMDIVGGAEALKG